MTKFRVAHITKWKIMERVNKTKQKKNIGSWLQIKAKVNSSADPRDIFKHTSKTLLDTSTFLFHLG